MSFKIDIIGVVKGAVNQVNAELPARAAAASVKLQNASKEVLRGQRIGRTYRAPSGVTYTASAPGEPPAERPSSGKLKNNWRTVQYGANHQNPAIETNVPYAWLDKGSPGGMIAPRPYAQKIIDMAKPEVEAIYAAPFN
ncbi:MAG: hypothetical protein RSD95_08175, partial [Clostridia bacterium]